MSGYSYTDIFDTKGIEYLIIIGFMLLMIPFWIFLNRPLKVRQNVMKSLGVLLLDTLRIPPGIFYSRNHTWTHMEKSGHARIGLDDLLLHITGGVEVRYVRNPGERVKKGDLLAEITRNGKQLNIASPVSGEIKRVNSGLSENPETLMNDPYGEGWMYKVKPDKWIEETASCYLAGEAIEWTGRELQRFKDFISMAVHRHSPGTSTVILQEGGELCDHPLSGMPDEVWQDFQSSFLDREGKK